MVLKKRKKESGEGRKNENGKGKRNWGGGEEERE